MKRKTILIVKTLILILIILGISKISKKDYDFSNFKKSKWNAVIDFVDEGRGTTIGITTPDSSVKNRIAGNLVTAKYSYPYYVIGDSIEKESGSDTFIIKRSGSFFKYV